MHLKSGHLKSLGCFELESSVFYGSSMSSQSVSSQMFDVTTERLSGPGSVAVLERSVGEQQREDTRPVLEGLPEKG